MFKKSEQDPSTATFDTIISESCTINGKVTEKKSLRIDGKIIGDVESEGMVTIGKSGKVHGDVRAQVVHLSGSVEGNIQTHNSLRITSSGKLVGDVQTETFIIDEKGVFDGSSKMTSLGTQEKEMQKDKVTELKKKPANSKE